MNRFVSTMASIAMAQSATIPAATTTTQATVTQATSTLTTEMMTLGGDEGNFTGSETGSGMDGTGNWMMEYEKFYNDENNFDYQGFLKNLKTDEKTDFMSFVTSNVVLE